MVDRITLTRDDIADDWPKVRSWGFPDVNTYEDFLAMVGPDEDAVGMFVQLPAWNPAPDAIKDGVARDYPQLVPLFFAMPVVKHLQGEHDQLSHGAWAAAMRGTPEYEAKMKQVDAMKAAGKVFPATRPELWQLLSEYGGDYLYDSDLGSFIRDHMSEEFDEMVAAKKAEMYGDYIMLTDEQARAARAEARAALESDAQELHREMLESAGYDPDAFASAFEHQDVDGTFASSVTDVEYDNYEQKIIVRGILLDGGQEVGEFTRIIDPMDPQYDGAAHVHRDLLTVEDHKRGEGLAGWFNENMQNVYLASGVEVVSIYAVDLSHGDPNTAGGPAVWASQGYDFDTDAYGSDSYGSVRRAIQSYVDDNPEYGSLPVGVQKNITGVLDRFATLTSDDPDFPTPREIWMLGRVGDIKGKTGWWPGKSILGHYGASRADTQLGGESGPRARYVLDLTEGKRVSTSQIEAKGVRERIAQRIVEARTGSGAQKALPLDEQFVTVNGQPIPLFPEEEGIVGSTAPAPPNPPTFTGPQIRFLDSESASPSEVE